MLSVYQHLRSVFYSSESKANAPTPPPNAAPLPPPGDQKQTCQTERTEKDATPLRQSRHFTGVVSVVNERCGMIDKKVFFDLSTVVGGRRPAVGESAHVIAERPHPHAGWKATRVEITSPWKPEEQTSKRVLIGYISQLSRSKGIATCSGEDIPFTSDALSSTGHYWPHTYDFIQLSLLLQDGKEIVSELCPLREKHVTGHVTSVSHSSGTIEEGVYFTFSACAPRGFAPQKGELVSAVCVEYKHSRYNWRAFLVEPTSKLEPYKSISPRSHPSPLPALTAQWQSLADGGGGVVVSDSLDFGEVQIGEEKTLAFTVMNQCGRGMALLYCRATLHDPQLKITHSEPWCTCRLDPSCHGDEGYHGDGSQGDGSENSATISRKETPSVDQSSSADSQHIHITDGGSYHIDLTLHASTLGLVNVVLVMGFAGGLKIARYARGSVVDPHVLTLGPTSAFSRRGNRSHGNRHLYHTKVSSHTVPGERPLKPRPLRLPHHLKPYNVPQDLRECVEGEEGGGANLEALDFIRPCLGEPLCMDNYTEKLSTLLHLEELHKEKDIAEYEMLSASPRRHGNRFISLLVPGLAEGRPHLLIGDRVILSNASPGVKGQVEPSWEGYVHEVRGEEILLRFAEVFHERFDNEDYDVMFIINRTPLRRMHHAVEMAKTIGTATLFPAKPVPKIPSLKLRNHSISIPNQLTPPSKINPLHTGKYFNPLLNARQRAAVSRIVRGQARPSPYILFGPPGTGKTVTLVEAILQVYTLSSATRILACAPSNSAADQLAERLHESGHMTRGVMVRLNALQRLVNPAPAIQPYCVQTDSVDTAALCRVVVATCVTAGLLHSLGLGAGHFSHVFVDEAGQAMEPECLLPISLLAGSEGQVVLAGDPQQLGPILASPLAAGGQGGGGGGGLGLSLLERLMQREAYLRDCAKFQDHGNYDPLMVTKLVDNYRSHEAILHLYSDTFYHSELRPLADCSLTHALETWNELPTKGFPLLFHGVLGKDMREGNSPSWFNPVEAVQVVKYVQALLDNATFAPKPSEVGVITPYRKQGEKIRLLLQSVGVEGVKVGSVEEFQGQERMAIILSTVRSSREHLGFDARHHLGFLSNPKRFNVAISRAQALLVVVGNPHLLCQDVYWRKLVDYTVSHSCYRGCALPQTEGGGGE